MHAYRLIVILFLVGACKASAPVGSTEVYDEDLTYLRPDIYQKVETAPNANTDEVVISGPVEFPGNIKNELDSINKIIAERNRSVKYADGFTIQIYTGSDREAANQASALAKTLYPELDPQISYYQPSYRVKAGQFLNRLVAHQKYEELKATFPKALLIPERIKINQ